MKLVNNYITIKKEIKNMVRITLLILSLTLPHNALTKEISKAKGILLEAENVQIQTSNGGTGSLTLPKGREVEIVEVAGNNTKISIPNLAEGWVETSKLKIIETTLFEASEKENSPAEKTENNSYQNNLENSPIEKTSPPAPHKNNISVKETEKVEEIDFTGRRCKGNNVSKTYTPIINGEEEWDGNTGTEVKIYTLVANNEGGKPLKLNGNLVPELEIKELKKDQNGNFVGSYRDLSCSCCHRRERKHIKGYYAELIINGNVVSTAKSELTTKQQKVLDEYLTSRKEL